VCVSVRACGANTHTRSRRYIGVVLILIFAEALALFGMILGIVLQGKSVTAMQGCASLSFTTAPTPAPMF
jgi:hypothetical protein